MSLLAGLRAHPFDPPIDPSGEEGRTLLRDELQKLPYQERKSLIDTVTEWLADRLETVAGDAAGSVAKVVLFLLIAALVALIIFAAARVTRSRRTRSDSATGDLVLDEDDVTADEYRERARAADSRGDHDAALLDWFRAIARASDERALLGDAPARTAHELVRALAPFFPTESTALRHAGDAFDDVRYGGGQAGAARSAAMRDLDARISDARPQHGATDQGGDLAVPGRWAP